MSSCVFSPVIGQIYIVTVFNPVIGQIYIILCRAVIGPIKTGSALVVIQRSRNTRGKDAPAAMAIRYVCMFHQG